MVQTLARGLAAMKAEKARIAEEQARRERPKAEYFNWKNNKNKDNKLVVTVRFLQEFSEEVEGFVPEYGLPVMSVEHQAPGKQGFMRRANCTMESENQCYACERHKDDRSLGWQQRRNFYTWALVDYKDGDGPKPVVLSRTFGSSFVDDLILEVEADENNQITNKVWTITRTGSGQKTAWKLREDKKTPLSDFDTTDLELPDLEEAVLRPIPYDDQAGYYGQVYKDGDPLDNDDEESAKQPKETGELTW